MNDLRLRQATHADIDKIFRIDHLRRYEQINKAIIQGACYVAEEGSRVVGFAIMDYSFFGFGFIELLMVDEEYRRRGIGAYMLECLFNLCTTEKLFTSTNESNAPMRELLVKAEFLPCGYIDALDEGDPELFYVKKVG